jgi:hypothetical protein
LLVGDITMCISPIRTAASVQAYVVIWRQRTWTSSLARSKPPDLISLILYTVRDTHVSDRRCISRLKRHELITLLGGATTRGCW